MTSASNSLRDSIQPARLNSWKEIAAYLERDERTVKRWEKSRALPVRRLPGGRGRVFAFRAEIDAWQVSSAHSRESESDAAVACLPEPLDGEEANEELSGTDWDPRHALPVFRPAPMRPAGFPLQPPEAGAAPQRAFWVLASIGLAAVALLVSGAISTRHMRGPVAQAAVAHKPPLDALNLYLNGRFYWNKRTPADLDQALSDFRAAVTIDPAYAAAWAGIADCYGLSTEFADAAPQAAYPRMLDAAERAVALDPNSAEAHRALGFVLFYWNWDREGSRREFTRAIQLDPRDATTYHWYGNVLMQSQQLPEAIHMLDEARTLDPTSPAILADRGLALQVAGNMKQAAEVWKALEKSDRSYLPPHWYLARLDMLQHDMPGFLAEMQEVASISHLPADEARVDLLQKAYLDKGEQGVLEATAKAHEESAAEHHSGYVDAAWTLDAASHREDALRVLREAYDQRDPAFPTIANPDIFKDLQAKPEYAELKARSLQPYPQTNTARVATLGSGPLGVK